MARKAIYKHATQVDTATYPDDGSSPVGSNEWNEAPDAQGMLGFSPQTATITISSGALTITDSITVAAAETGTTDTIDTIAITNTNEYDLLYLFADTGDTITLTNTSSPSVSGQIRTISDANETLSTTVPTILIRKGNYWYGYGGGVVNALNDVGDVTITSASSGDIITWNGSAWVNVAHSGDATMNSSGVVSVSDLTISSEAQGDVLYFNGSNWVRLAAGTSGHFLKTQGTGANPVWAAAGGGDEANPVLQANGYTPTYTSPSTEGTDKVSIWVETIDSNNQGVYAKIKKNGSYVTVQIA